MENDNLGPVGERDYPSGCLRPLPRRAQTLRAATSRLEEEHSETPHVAFPEGFHTFNAREQFMARRHIYEFLRQYYESRKDNDNDKGKPRPDLAAMKQMREEGLLFVFKGIGEVPGVEVGDSFNYRSEMVVVGLHSLIQSGIAYADLGDVRLATSIVASGGYEDDNDFGEELHYSGHGGNDYKGEKRQKEDQTERLGNEAMMNSFRLKKPVRVSRGHDVRVTGGWNKTYSYDGLYAITEAKVEEGASHHKVFKFILKRLPGQAELTSRPVQFRGSQVH